jgi:hypothetical protein
LIGLHHLWKVYFDCARASENTEIATRFDAGNTKTVYCQSFSRNKNMAKEIYSSVLRAEPATDFDP